MYMEASATAEPSMGKYLPRAEMPRSTCKIRAGKQDYAQTLHYETWGDVLLILRRQVVTVFSHIIKKYNLPFFFFHALSNVLHKMSHTDRQMSFPGMLTPTEHLFWFSRTKTAVRALHPTPWLRREHWSCVPAPRLDRQMIWGKLFNIFGYLCLCSEKWGWRWQDCFTEWMKRYM